MSKFKYFPSFSVAGFGQALRKDLKLKNGLTSRFYSKEFPEKYRHTEFLISAGHFLKRPDLYGEHGFTKDNLIMGDSGGFQIASGALKWNTSLPEKVFTWLENNSDIAMNLDIPPKMKYEGMYEECLKISKDNFKYFADNQTGKTDFLNVVQGTNEVEYENWYNEIKDFEFQGWAIGGGGRSVYAFMSGVLSLLNGKEHLKDRNKYLHILGISKISDFLMLNQLQKSLNEVDSKMVVTTDSSSPDRAVVFGGYYLDYNFKKASFQSINVPKHDDTFKNQPLNYLPVSTDFDREYLKDALTWEDTIEWQSTCTTAIRLHNLMVFKEAIDKAEYYVYTHDYMLQQIVSTDMFKLLKSLEEMIKSDNPKVIFEKHKQLYRKMSNTHKEPQIKTHQFF
jgi:queuine/archaeosine tRNA-ribosyltransferase